jgi:hypothetical protein
MLFISTALLVAASLALAGALGLSMWQRTADNRYFRAVEYILNDTDEDDLAVIKFFLQVREVDLLLKEGIDYQS